MISNIDDHKWWLCITKKIHEWYSPQMMSVCKWMIFMNDDDQMMMMNDKDDDDEWSWWMIKMIMINDHDEW